MHRPARQKLLAAGPEKALKVDDIERQIVDVHVLEAPFFESSRSVGKAHKPEGSGKGALHRPSSGSCA